MLSKPYTPSPAPMPALRGAACKTTKRKGAAMPLLAKIIKIRLPAPASYLNNRHTSSPNAYSIRANSSTMPTIWAYSMNLSLGLRPVIIS